MKVNREENVSINKIFLDSGNLNKSYCIYLIVNTFPLLPSFPVTQPEDHSILQTLLEEKTNHTNAACSILLFNEFQTHSRNYIFSFPFTNLNKCSINLVRKIRKGTLFLVSSWCLSSSHGYVISISVAQPVTLCGQGLLWIIMNISPLCNKPKGYA